MSNIFLINSGSPTNCGNSILWNTACAVTKEYEYDSGCEVEFSLPSYSGKWDDYNYYGCLSNNITILQSGYIQPNGENIYLQPDGISVYLYG